MLVLLVARYYSTRIHTQIQKMLTARVSDRVFNLRVLSILLYTILGTHLHFPVEPRSET